MYDLKPTGRYKLPLICLPCGLQGALDAGDHLRETVWSSTRPRPTAASR